MTALDATTRVEVILREQRATIADLREALDILTAEGVPDTFEVTVEQTHDRVHEQGVAYTDQQREHVLRVSAERASKRGTS